ncbi:30S ribosomal protein S8e [Methanocorpusculum bavaricum]|uniref:30S ribosomal protein S8e n=1 Tax=Methanocorpusculum bavaricum TaxID=71518 RepID=UPI0005B28060|nr:30S ribosomal protein S8e [Methanocorpusculum bavaricum]MDD2249350.1 30S ribosomal protein S8e [Methanocorpusculum sp.]MDD4423267.1 30S ribosomal protein S8e [Methanocorpusculum parvum]MDD2802776.1 30S ribosomal protein S8e [Methanocorpusculum sp.]MDD3046837.1 30S ribosomal protein S8e [Methanocorpusculum sp.]MDD3912130.1 30S ribosomal protein S8e [Methanocorpusculum sp.]
MLWQGKSVRKATGGRYHASRGKKRFEIGRSPADTIIGITRVKTIRVTGGNTKVRALRCEFANVSDKKTGKVQKVKINSVAENAANPNYVRRNLMTKGAIITTELGKAQIVSRPGQDGVINAILIE